MNKRTIALLALMMAGCGQQAAPTVDTKAEEARLIETSRQWAALAAEGKDAEAVSRYWAEDAVLMQDAAPTLRGRAEARKMVAGAFSMPGFKISWEPVEAHVAASGDLGYLIERTSITEPGPDGKPVVQVGRAVTVWRKQADGQWRNVVDISNVPAPAK